MERETKNRYKRGRKRKKEGGRIEGLGDTRREREFVVYFVFKEAHLFWQKELSIQTIFTIQKLKNRIITILYLRRERGRENEGGEKRKEK